MLLSYASICSNPSLWLTASTSGVCSAPANSSWMDWWKCQLTPLVIQPHQLSHTYGLPAHPVTWPCSLNPGQLLEEMFFFLGRSWLFLFYSLCHLFCSVPKKVGHGLLTGEPVWEPSKSESLARESQAPLTKLERSNYRLVHETECIPSVGTYKTQASQGTHQVPQAFSGIFSLDYLPWSIAFFPPALTWCAGGTLGEAPWILDLNLSLLGACSVSVWPWWAVSALWTLIFYMAHLWNGS